MFTRSSEKEKKSQLRGMALSGVKFTSVIVTLDHKHEAPEFTFLKQNSP